MKKHSLFVAIVLAACIQPALAHSRDEAQEVWNQLVNTRVKPCVERQMVLAYGSDMENFARTGVNRRTQLDAKQVTMYCLNTSIQELGLDPQETMRAFRTIGVDFEQPLKH